SRHAAPRQPSSRASARPTGPPPTMRTGVSIFTIARLRYADGASARYGTGLRPASRRRGARPAGFPVAPGNPGAPLRTRRSDRPDREGAAAEDVAAPGPATSSAAEIGRAHV